MTIEHSPLRDEDRTNESIAEEQRAEIIVQLKILNSYLSMGFDEVLDENDLND